MKFIALRSNIREGIGIIEKAGGENPNLPILKNFLIEAENNTITFTATNLEIAITHKVAGKVIENGKATVPISLFSSLISNIQSDRLNFQKKGEDIEVATDNYSAVLHSLPADDFPLTPKIATEDHFLEVRGGILKDAIQQVMVASQFSDLRPELNSVLLDFSLDSLKFAATDSFRLAEKALPASAFSTKGKDPFKVLIPLRTAQEVARIVRDDESVKIFHDENQVLWKTEKTEVISRLLEGNFPDYSAITPRSFTAEITVSRDELFAALKLASVFGQRNSEVKVAIHPGKKALEISSGDQALGENTNLISAKIKGEPMAAHFNWRYLSDPLKMMKSGEVFLGLQEDAGPALVRGAGDASYFYIVKPVLKG